MSKAVVKLQYILYANIFFSTTVMDSTKDCVTQLTNMKVVWRYFLVVMRNLVSLAGITR